MKNNFEFQQEKKEITCKRCGVVAQPDVYEVTFRNGKKHLQADCNSCGSFVKYIKRSKVEKTMEKEIVSDKASGIAIWVVLAVIVVIVAIILK